MKVLTGLLRWGGGALLVLSTAFQLLAMIGGIMLGNDAIQKETPWLVPVWVVAIVALLAGFILLAALGRRGRWPIWSLVLGLVGAVLALLVALALKDLFPAQISSTGGTQGLTIWRLCYRHFSSVLVGVLIAIDALLQMAENKTIRQREEQGEYRSAYDLSGKALFKDESTIGLDSYAGGEKVVAPKKLKRSLRAAQKKETKATNPTD